MKKINILVTGAGSGVGQSIIRSLKKSKLKSKINVFISDISNLNPYPIYNFSYIKIPKVEQKNSKNKIKKILIKKKINILFIGSEYEIYFFSKYKNFFEKIGKLKICVADIKTIKISNDKYKTYKFLKKNNLPYPSTIIVNKKSKFDKIKKQIKIPFILKDRFETSSRSVFVIKNSNDFNANIKTVKYPIVQEKLISKSNNNFKNAEEFTCSFFTLSNKKILGPFIARRIIKFGTSWIVDNKKKDNKVLNLIKLISSKLDNVGSFNIQLINTKKGPIPFEFNSRFSGTTSIRSNFGFNEPDFFIKNYFLNQEISQKNIKIIRGTAFRYIAEKII